MGKRGPAPKPTVLRVLHGDREDRINRDEPIPDASEVLAPQWLPEPAREVWDSLAPDLIRKGVLTPWDVDSFADFCAVVVVNRRALADVTANGTTITVISRSAPDGTVVYATTKNPAWQVAKESSVLITTLGGRFGLNPSDRSQLRVEGGKPDAGQGADRLLS